MRHNNNIILDNKNRSMLEFLTIHSTKIGTFSHKSWFRRYSKPKFVPPRIVHRRIIFHDVKMSSLCNVWYLFCSERTSEELCNLTYHCFSMLYTWQNNWIILKYIFKDCEYTKYTEEQEGWLPQTDAHEHLCHKHFGKVRGRGGPRKNSPHIVLTTKQNLVAVCHTA